MTTAKVIKSRYGCSSCRPCNWTIQRSALTMHLPYRLISFDLLPIGDHLTLLSFCAFLQSNLARERAYVRLTMHVRYLWMTWSRTINACAGPRNLTWGAKAAGACGLWLFSISSMWYWAINGNVSNYNWLTTVVTYAIVFTKSYDNVYRSTHEQTHITCHWHSFIMRQSTSEQRKISLGQHSGNLQTASFCSEWRR